MILFYDSLLVVSLMFLPCQQELQFGVVEEKFTVLRPLRIYFGKNILFSPFLLSFIFCHYTVFLNHSFSWILKQVPCPEFYFCAVGLCLITVGFLQRIDSIFPLGGMHSNGAFYNRQLLEGNEVRQHPRRLPRRLMLCLLHTFSH